MRIFVTDAEQQAHNDKLIDLCYHVAVKVCANAEGLGGIIDWDLPSDAQFRQIVRKARANAYRATAPQPRVPDDQK